MLEALSTVSAVAAGLFIALVVRGFIVMALRRDGTAVHYLSMGIVLVFVCAGARAVYWDALPALIGPELWSIWHRAVGRALPNLVFNLIWIAGSVMMLILLRQLIPPHERAGYSIWTAPWYPRKGWLGGIVDMLRTRR
ncbi:MAG: hypothetical protein L0G27_10080 [Paracoccus sp. (in: a-proteobacteria)]|nr:hypothetical protein [Paracoccus sp. (in: a-proteobacteria)]